MGKIATLSDVLANQIAAGEVIERPASVVKELVENAIDAQATRVDVLVEAAGTDLIRVIDDGQGIADDDVETAFLRHATSKIATRHDLFRVHSLGFRGEALPSIASVSEVTLVTAQADSAQGSQVVYKGGLLESHTSASARQGTDITVKNLFFNTPARLKYLKSPSTELAQITDVLHHIALSHPEVSLRLRHGDKEIMRTVGNGNLQQVIAAIYGTQQARKMVEFTAKDNDFEINGYTSLPELTRANRSYMAVLINGRYVKNYQLTNAIIKGYGSKVMVGRFPIAVIDIQMDPLLVDVNVHPQKHEVRLSKETELVNLVREAIAERLARENLIPDGLDNLMNQTVLGADLTLREPVVETPVAEAVEKQAATSADEVTKVDHEEPVESITVAHESELDNLRSFSATYSGTEASPFAGHESQVVGVAAQETLWEEDKAETQETFPKLSYIGQMHGTFLFAQGEAGLYMIDQHAAQERIKYEKYRVEIGQTGLERQQLLVPIVVSFSAVDALKLQGHLEELDSLGITLEEFGVNTFILREHPGWFVKGQEESTLREMLDWYLRDEHLTLEKFREKTAIMMACKRSIKANWSLNDFEARGLIAQLAETENPYNCPHGRPTVVTLSMMDVEKMFKRIQDSHTSWTEYDEHPF
ncbi:DNA mismatch repair endonuclease MutL [Weissella ceti]|uniref:DNA mismatch repair protein MutL n=1 Tax=Weissella ceti TaxID=759620 RepID=A0ABT3E2E8_9LACO|nr:DNA mismatch repair endonuclease MutL [Weissella ceti]MCW0952589.1 DNA mismatch repair endonuclease MutL [Weissella ceti]QVK11747.1 DNA mismatch repair endonuclease MutL [Weissella ceti]